MLQTTQRLLTPRSIHQLRPIRLGALQKRTLGARSTTSTTKTKLLRVSAQTRAFHSSSKNDIAFTPAGSFKATGHQHYRYGIIEPFSTAKAWPAGLFISFLGQGHGSLLGGDGLTPYDLLLHYCVAFDFHIRPPAPLIGPDPREAIFFDFLVVYDKLFRPVIIVEMKRSDDGWVNKGGLLRAQADERMRRQFNITFGECALPRLWGLCFIGTSLRVYRGDVATRTIEPAFEGHPSPGHDLPHDFLEGAWNIDIRSQEGFDKMKEIMGDVIGNGGAVSAV